MSDPQYILRRMHPDQRMLHQVSVQGHEGVHPMINTPYITQTQFHQVKEQYESDLKAWKQKNDPSVPPPVPQPPTTLAAMHRSDLTQKGRESILQKAAPAIAGLEKKYRMLVTSSARERPEETSTNDFTVRVGSDVLGVPVNGIEIIGYSLPQSEFVVEPNETAIPFRYGWCAVPRGRMYGLRVNTLTGTAYIAGRGGFQFDGSPEYVLAELPLVRNPIVRIRRLEDALEITCARRIGSRPSTFTNLVLDGLWSPFPQHAFPESYTIDPSTIVEQDVTGLYVMTDTEPPHEPILPFRSTWNPEHVTPAHILVLHDPKLVSAFPDSTFDVSLDVSHDLIASLGSLYVPPFASGQELAQQLSAQLTSLSQWRHQRSGPSYWPVQDIRLERSPRSGRFVLHVSWTYAHGIDGQGAPFSAYINSLAQGFTREHIIPLLNPVVTALGDTLASRFSLPDATGPETWTETYATYTARDQPVLFNEDTVMMAPVASEGDAFWNATNVVGKNMAFTAASSTPSAPSSSSPRTFTIPFRLGHDSTVVYASVREGEYRPWALAVQITKAIQAVPSLRALALVCTPRFSDISPTTLVGFRFESTTHPTPHPFDLAFDIVNTDPTPDDIEHQTPRTRVIHPTRLGFLPLHYTGRTVYDPVDMTGGNDPYLRVGTPLSFPSAELGNGVPSPLPFIPRIFPVSNGTRALITQDAYAPVEIERILVPSHAHARSTAPPVQIHLGTAALFYHHQPVHVNLTFPAQKLEFNGVHGLVRTEAINDTIFPTFKKDQEQIMTQTSMTTLSAPGFMPLPTDTPNPIFENLDETPNDLNTIIQVFTALHDPTNSNSRALIEALVDLFGMREKQYPNGLVGPSGEDGLVRVFLKTHNIESLPNPDQLDQMLTMFTQGQHTQRTYQVFVRLIVAFVQIKGLDNITDLSLLNLIRLIKLYQGPNLDNARTYDKVYRMIHAFAAANHVGEPDRIIAYSSNGTVSPPVRPGQTLILNAQGTEDPTPTISPTVQVWGQSEAQPCVHPLSSTSWLVAVPHNIRPTSLTWGSMTIPIDPWTPADILETGRLYTMDLGTAPDATQGILGTIIDHHNGMYTFRTGFNAQEVIQDAGNTYSMALQDSPATTAAKMFIIANKYSVSIPAHVWLDLRGTLRFPFDIHDAFRDLDIPYVNDSRAVLDLMKFHDPGIQGIQQATIVPRPTYGSAILDDPTSKLQILSVYYTLLQMAQDPSTTRTLTRDLEHPMSIDFASRSDYKLRPERLGFQMMEYTRSEQGINPRATTAMYRTPQTIGSVIDVQMESKGYILLSVVINGSPTRDVVLPDGRLQATMSNARDASRLVTHSNGHSDHIISVSNSSLDGQRKIVTATAYVMLSERQRLLDRQEDRVYQQIPTSTFINTIRIRAYRPDGTLYNFHGREVSIMLKFTSHKDNPAFIPGSREHA